MSAAPWHAIRGSFRDEIKLPVNNRFSYRFHLTPGTNDPISRGRDVATSTSEDPPPGSCNGTGTWPAIVVSGFSRTHGRPDDVDLFQAALTDYDISAIDEPSDDSWCVYFQSDSERDRALDALRGRFPGLSFAPLDVADEDWAAKSQASLRAIQVGSVIVAPPWDVPTTVVIQPSMGFGTGHHATTRLCLLALQRLELNGRNVLDIGTGSALLAIVASRLGAGDVTGIDDDADAIHAAWENLALNPGANVTLIVGDVRSTELVPADVILANLTGGLLVSSAERLRKLTNARGRLILSGFQMHEEREVLTAYGAFSVEQRGEEEGWVCLTFA
jgi:ribosomal protein L11 methyltransferase